MNSFWLLLFLVKLYSRINIFKFIKKKHGNDIYTLVRTFENIKARYEKILLDIKLLKIYKVEHLIRTFSNIRLGTSGTNIKLKHCIARIILEDELQHKHREKKRLKSEIRKISIQLKLSLSLLIYSTLLRKINIAVKSISIAISFKHKKKLMNLRKKQQEHNKRIAVYVPKELVHNFSSHKLSKEKHEALSYSLDYHISSKVTRNSLNKDFEMFFQNLLNNISPIPEGNLARIKTKLHSTCEKYYQVKPYFKYNQVTQNLSKNNEIVILKQDKGRRVMILDRSKYMEKCLSNLSTSQFDEIDHDLTAYIEGKVQKIMRKTKSKLLSFAYSKI